MGKKCQCCGREAAGVRCGYCGFYEVIALDDSGDHLVKELVQAHRQELVDSLTELSVTTYECEWKDDQPVSRKKELKLANGSECYSGVKWCRKKFGQLHPGQKQQLKISYQIGGKKKQLKCTVPSKQCEDFWQIGLQIDECLRLRVFLGSPKNYAKSQFLPLKWE